jgi:hypothetical protein
MAITINGTTGFSVPSIVATSGMETYSWDAGGYGLRVRASASTAKAIIQYTNNPATIEWGNLSMINQDLFVFRTSLGDTTQIPYTNFSFNGGTVAIREFTNSGIEISDWPVPTLSIIAKDDYTGNTVLSFQYKDDGNYTTAQAFWNFRLYGTANQTTSSSTTELHLTGPGPLQMSATSTGGVRLTNGATSWAAVSDENMKDIIEPISDAINKVSTLRSVIGKYKNDPEGTRRSFLIAQDVQNVLPEAVATGIQRGPADEDDISKPLEETEVLLLSYSDVIPLLVAAIKELSEELDTIKNGAA